MHSETVALPGVSEGIGVSVAGVGVLRAAEGDGEQRRPLPLRRLQQSGLLEKTQCHAGRCSQSC